MKQASPSATSRWLTTSQYAEMYNVSRMTLATWRWRDRRAGRKAPLPGYPKYRYFGGSVVRYLAESDIDGETAA
jgi:hypothetical protein